MEYHLCQNTTETVLLPLWPCLFIAVSSSQLQVVDWAIRLYSTPSSSTGCALLPVVPQLCASTRSRLIKHRNTDRTPDVTHSGVSGGPSDAYALSELWALLLVLSHVHFCKGGTAVVLLMRHSVWDPLPSHKLWWNITSSFLFLNQPYTVAGDENVDRSERNWVLTCDFRGTTKVACFEIKIGWK